MDSMESMESMDSKDSMASLESMESLAVLAFQVRKGVSLKTSPSDFPSRLRDLPRISPLPWSRILPGCLPFWNSWGVATSVRGNRTGWLHSP